MERDFERKGAVLIKTQFGVVSATPENFTLPAQNMAENEAFRKAVKIEGGLFCLPPWALDIPF